MLRILLLLALLFIIVYFLRRLFSVNGASAKRSGKRLRARMVKCGHCGTYVPEEDAVKVSGKTYCSEAHRDADG